MARHTSRQPEGIRIHRRQLGDYGGGRLQVLRRIRAGFFAPFFSIFPLLTGLTVRCEYCEDNEKYCDREVDAAGLLIDSAEVKCSWCARLGIPCLKCEVGTLQQRNARLKKELAYHEKVYNNLVALNKQLDAETAMEEDD